MVEVVSLELPAVMEVPVAVQIARALQRAKPQDGLRARQAPTGASHVHPVLDQMATSPFDHAGGDGQTRCQELVVANVASELVEVVRSVLEGLRLVARQPALRDRLPQRLHHPMRASSEEPLDVTFHPRLRRRVTLVEQGPRGLPDVLGDVDEVGADPTVRRVGLKLGGQTPPGCDRTT